MFKPKGRHVRQSQVERFTRYSIRKVSFGAASVAVATGLFFLGGGSVQAAEPIINSEHTEVQNPQNLTDKSSEPSKEVTGQGSATAKEADGQNNTSVKESSPANETSVVETPEVVTEKVAINTASLEDLVAKAESRLSQLTESKRTKSFIDDTKILVNKAKELLNDDTKTQAKVDALAKQLSSSLSVLNSIKLEATEEDKVNKNQDPRNGKAIPGNGESGFRADTFIVNESNTTTVPDTATTGTDKFTFVALPENDSRRNSGAIAIADGQAGDIVVKGTGAAPTDLEIEMYSSQRTGQQENPVAMSTVNGQPVTSPGRMDYPLSKEQVEKLEKEAKLWVGKEKPDGNRVTTNLGAVYGSSGAYEFLATEIYKMGYEQGVDRAYIPNISNRFAVTDKAKEAGWKIKSISPTNLPSGLIYDKESDSIQGRVVSNVQNGVQDLRFTVEAENEKTHQIVSMEFRNLRSGWIAWQDSKPPRLEVSDDAYETQVGNNVNIDIAYKDDAGSNFSGSRRQVNYRLASGKVVTIPNQNFRQAVSGLAGYATTKQAGELDGTKTSIPGISYSLSQDGTPVETDENGDQSIYGKGKLTGTATTAGIYTVSVYAKDYNTTQKSDSTWIHSGHEVQKYITVVVKPTITVKNVHSYATTIPVTISDGASSAEVKLPNGKITKLEVRDGQWVVASGTTNEKAVQGTALGQVGSEINIPVSEEDTKTASTDTIVAKAITENVKATLLRNELSLTDNTGVHKARLDETTGHWELDKNYREVKESTPNGGYKLTKRQVFTEVQTDGTINYYIYSYTRTYNANDEIVSVNEVRRDKTVVPRLNTENQEGNAVVVEYNPVTQTWTSSDNSRVTATKEGNFWNIRTESGFTGLVKGSIAESDDKASILNNAPTASSTSYTTVKGATVDLVKQASAAVTIRDTEDDATTSPKKETTITKVTVTAPSGQQTEYTDIEQAKAHLLSEVGTYKVKVEVKDSNGNVVTANTDTETGTDKGAETAVNSTTYTITVEDQPTNKLYTVEDDTVTNDQLKEKVNPTAVEGFTPTKNDITDIPTTVGKAGQTLPTPATVTYTKGTETISVATKVDVVVLPKVTPEGVKVLKDSTDLEEVVKAKATEAATATTKLPDGVTVRVKEVKAGTVPATTATGVQTPATAVVEYVKDGNVVASKEVKVPVTVVGSTPSKIVVFEGDTVEAKTVQDAVTPGTDGTKGNPAIPEDLTKTTGKKEVTVPVTYEGIEAPEQVKVPVTVLPVAKGEVTVPKGETTDKVKEVAKAKAEEVANSADFKAKLPDGAKDVEVGAITKEVLAAITTEAGTNKGTVKVPVTYTVDSVKYTKDAEITVNVVGSNADPVYVVEGDKPEVDKVKDAVTPGEGGTVQDPREVDLPNTNDKVGATDVTVPTKVKYANGEETVNVPVTVLPKVTPEGVKVLKDSTALEEVVKAKATEAATATTKLPDGVTVRVKEVKAGTVPATTATGVQTPATAVVEYVKDGKVVASKEVKVPVTVVGSTASKIVVFEGEKPTADQAKDAVTPGTDGTKGEPTTLPETTGKAGATDVKVDVPVTYDNGKLTETVSVPVTVLPKATGEVEVPKGSTVDKVKEVAKAKASALVEAADFKGKLPTGATVTVGDITEAVAETLTNEKGTNKGVVNVPATYTVDGKEYPTTVPVTINVLGSEPKTVYTVEGTKPDAEKVKNAVTPGTGGTVNAPTEAGLPETTGKVGAKDVTATTTVTYSTGNETVNVPVEVLPKATPEKVITLKDTTSDSLKTAVKEKAQAAVGKLALPSGVTAELDPNQTYTVPATTSNGDKDTVPVKVQYKDSTGTVVAEDTINVPVTVVSSTPSKIVVFEGEKPTADQAKDAVTPGTDGTKGEPTTLPETAGKAGATDITVDVPVTYDNGKLTETVKVPVTVLPKPEADEILVPKNGDKEKAKEKVLAQAKKAIEDAAFKGKLPQGATVAIDETATITVPDLTEDTEVDVTVKYTVDGQDKTTTVKVPVTVVEGVPQIVPVKETNDVLPDPEKSIDKTDYPEGSTFRYKTPDGQTSPIDVTTTGDKNVVVEVLDPQGNTIVEVPATVRVVESYPKYVPVDPAKKQPDPKDNINPNDFPTGTTFEYKDNTPVDTTTPGEKPVTVVAKLNGQPITEIPAKIVVVEPKTQYVPVNAEGDKKPKPQDSITPDDYPEGSTFEYKTPEGKTEAYDGSTPGEKDVTVVVKDSDGDPIVEVPAKIKVVQGKEQLTPVNAEDKDKPKAEDSITPGDYPAGSTFEYKIPEGKTEAYDGSTPGDKPVTVVVKDKDGKVLVEVPATIKVVETKPTPIETPVTNTPLTKDDYTKGMKIPEGATVKVGDLPDLTTPGKKDPVKVTITLPNGKSYTVDVPVTVTPVKEIETPVTNTPLTKDDYTKGITIPEGGKVTNVENIPDLTTPGKKEPVKVTVTLPNGKVVTVEVPVNVTPVKEIETPVTNTPLTKDDYTKGITIPEGGKITNVENIPDLTTPGKKDPVKVTIELPNGKVITVDVPVTVTPVKEIETPVTTGKLTPEDILKQIKVPEGATTKVENIPDLTTPGKKDPVKVTVTLPNGKVVTVDVPVTVTPVKEIETPVTTTPLTPDDYTKGITIPEGGKVTKVENIPDLTTPGKKDPVKVTIELPNGKVITVDVPVTVTPVKEIETPVTKDKLTPEDILKQIKVPDGATVKVGDLPDLTTPGKKDPVKVTITLPNGKVVTVEVPVNVTPITPIETPVTKDKLTPEDILKQIKVPDGATVQVGDLPDLTTPGKKDPVKVTITLPNGKVVTVEIPVTVTPIEDIVKKQGDPITTEDVEKHIPKGAKVISIGDKPTTDVPGERPSIPVVIELPNGIRVTVNVPVIVTPKVTPVVVKVGTPVTPEDVKKHIELPKGWTVTKVGEIPTTMTPGTKPVVPVEIQLPDGRKITVDVPVIVTPTVRQIVVPQGTPITPDDVKGHIDLPKEPGWEIVEVGEIPTTIPAGVKPSVKVKIKVPTGEIVEVEVPIIVTPKVTPIVVEVGTPITKEDVIKKVGLPEGWEIVEVGEIPTTETPGTKPVVKVKVKLPDGRIITVEVPVTVTPKSQNGGGVISQNGNSTVQIVTEYLDENGNRITSDKEGKHNPIELEGYEFSHSTTDAKGNTLHHYKKVNKPINQEQPSSPETPTSPEKPVATPVQDSKQVAETTVSNDKKELPNTGTEDKAGLASLGLLGMLGAFGLVARKKKED